MSSVARGDPEGPQPGESFGAFRLLSVVGEGATGLVFRAVREPQGQVVALKVMKTELANDETFRRRFVREARVAAEVRHEHLVPIHEAGEHEGRPYLAVSYVSGGTLEDRLASGPLGLDEILTVAAQVGAGLDALHAQGIVHRDVKPSNIMLTEDRSAALTDFGLAKGRAYTVLTKTGQIMGTLDYMAPEVISGKPAGPASDLYAFGCVMYTCVAGAPPFAGRGLFEMGVAHLQDEPPDPLANRTDLPRSLAGAVLQSMAKEPAYRPPSGTAFAKMLRVAAKPDAG
jgi:serine/threonine-protein kinase